jgi:hypothetical protein
VALADGRRLDPDPCAARPYVAPHVHHTPLCALHGARPAGFARTRTATVTATEPTRFLTLDWALVGSLMKGEPAFAEQLERTSRERLARL